MSSGQPSDASVARVAVENHPLAAGAISTPVGSQSQQLSPPRSRLHYEQNATTATPPVGMVSSSPQRVDRPNPSVATPNSNPGVSSGDNSNGSPSSKSLDTLADEFLSSKPPPVALRPHPLPRGEVGIARLRTLVERRAWGDVLKLASSLLNIEEGGGGAKKSPSKSNKQQYSKVYTSLLVSEKEKTAAEPIDDVPDNVRQETIEILMLRCNALLKLRRYSDLSKEVEQWSFLKQNDVKAPSIEWLPWGIHILAGQSLEYAGDLKQATDVLCHLREEIPSTESSWIASLDNALANLYIRRGEWRLALGSLDRIMDLIPEVVRAEVRSFNINVDAEAEELMTSFLTQTYICEILSREGRIFLQIGALSEAGEVFEAVKTIWKKIDESTIPFSSIPLPEEISNRNKTLRAVTQASLEINDGLMNFSDSKYSEALQSFSNATKILTGDGTGFHSQYRAQDWVGPAIAGSQPPSLLYNEAVNNSSLCNLYMCNMKEAVVELESLVREDPTAFLTERVAFNLCTLYELGSDSAVATRKKRVLQLIAKRFFLHDVGPESFRVS